MVMTHCLPADALPLIPVHVSVSELDVTVSELDISVNKLNVSVSELNILVSELNVSVSELDISVSELEISYQSASRTHMKKRQKDPQLFPPAQQFGASMQRYGSSRSGKIPFPILCSFCGAAGVTGACMD